jgi:hypothetical protein
MSGGGGRVEIGSSAVDCPLPSSLYTGSRGGGQLQMILTGERAAVEVMLPAAKAFH